jgi:hypothetical protein
MACGGSCRRNYPPLLCPHRCTTSPLSSHPLTTSSSISPPTVLATSPHPASSSVSSVTLSSTAIRVPPFPPLCTNLPSPPFLHSIRPSSLRMQPTENRTEQNRIEVGGTSRWRYDHYILLFQHDIIVFPVEEAKCHILHATSMIPHPPQFRSSSSISFPYPCCNTHLIASRNNGATCFRLLLTSS